MYAEEVDFHHLLVTEYVGVAGECVRTCVILFDCVCVPYIYMYMYDWVCVGMIIINAPGMLCRFLCESIYRSLQAFPPKRSPYRGSYKRESNP